MSSVAQKNREKIAKFHDSICAQAKALMLLKNADYGGETDPLKNLRLHGLFGISVRLHDKVCRLESASKRDLKVASETIEDTCKDIVNYAILALLIYDEEVEGVK